MLVSPFPRSAYALAWEWLHQFRHNNFDDTGPKTFPDFALEMERRERFERTWGVEHAGQFVGLIGYAPMTRRAGMFHGIVFDQQVHGKGIAKAAVRAVLTELFEEGGVDKISAAYFADNRKIGRLLLGLGAQREGYLRRQTLRDGVPIDMELVAFFRGD